MDEHPEAPLPVTWATCSIGEVSSRVVVGYVGPCKQYYASDGIPFLMGKNVKLGKISLADLERVTEAFHEDQKKSQVNPGDIVVVRIGRSGESAEVPPSLIKANCGGLVIIKAPIAIDTQYIVTYLNSPEGQKTSIEESCGVTRQTLNTAKVESMAIPVAPLSEQRRIVAKLDALQSRTRLAREALAAIPALLDHYRQSVLSAAFRGDLSDDQGRAAPTIVTGHDPEKLAKLRQVYNAPNEVPEIPFPERWSVRIAAEIVDPDANIMYGIIQPGPEYPGGVPYVRGMDIQDGKIAVDQLRRTSPEIASRYARAALRSGDVLLGIIRATKVAIVPVDLDGANITQGTARFRPSKLIRTDFLAHYLASPFAQSWLHAHYRGIDMPGLNLADVRMLPVPVPSLDEQKRLADRLSAALRWIDNINALIVRLISSGAAIDQSLLATAFRGELVPQDPADEPASVLLDRIRAARAQAGDAPRTRRTRTPAAAPPPARAAEPATPYRAAASDPYATILAALRAKGSLTSADAQTATGLDAASVRPLLQRLVAESAVKVEGRKRGTRYVTT